MITMTWVVIVMTMILETEPSKDAMILNSNTNNN